MYKIHGDIPNMLPRTLQHPALSMHAHVRVLLCLPARDNVLWLFHNCAFYFWKIALGCTAVSLN